MPMELRKPTQQMKRLRTANLNPPHRWGLPLAVMLHLAGLERKPASTEETTNKNEPSNDEIKPETMPVGTTTSGDATGFGSAPATEKRKDDESKSETMPVGATTTSAAPTFAGFGKTDPVTEETESATPWPSSGNDGAAASAGFGASNEPTINEKTDANKPETTATFGATTSATTDTTNEKVEPSKLETTPNPNTNEEACKAETAPAFGATTSAPATEESKASPWPSSEKEGTAAFAGFGSTPSVSTETPTDTAKEQVTAPMPFGNTTGGDAAFGGFGTEGTTTANPWPSSGTDGAGFGNAPAAFEETSTDTTNAQDKAKTPEATPFSFGTSAGFGTAPAGTETEPSFAFGTSATNTFGGNDWSGGSGTASESPFPGFGAPAEKQPESAVAAEKQNSDDSGLNAPGFSGLGAGVPAFGSDSSSGDAGAPAAATGPSAASPVANADATAIGGAGGSEKKDQVNAKPDVTKTTSAATSGFVGFVGIPDDTQEVLASGSVAPSPRMWHCDGCDSDMPISSAACEGCFRPRPGVDTGSFLSKGPAASVTAPREEKQPSFHINRPGKGNIGDAEESEEDEEDEFDDSDDEDEFDDSDENTSESEEEKANSLYDRFSRQKSPPRIIPGRKIYRARGRKNIARPLTRKKPTTPLAKIPAKTKKVDKEDEEDEEEDRAYNHDHSRKRVRRNFSTMFAKLPLAKAQVKPQAQQDSKSPGASSTTGAWKCRNCDSSNPGNLHFCSDCRRARGLESEASEAPPKKQHLHKFQRESAHRQFSNSFGRDGSEGEESDDYADDSGSTDYDLADDDGDSFEEGEIADIGASVANLVDGTGSKKKQRVAEPKEDNAQPVFSFFAPVEAAKPEELGATPFGAPASVPAFGSEMPTFGSGSFVFNS
eukprot:TRINITY_DN2908_c0_g1_i1.p1 TRINITY_DN2908_c0_g1~~TRINITY_DN2908_c0_g1_i1.p1  ORF type:complete len:888 (+),score=241.82 TRINITY_DN2908_c0_g1_i1:554-3217(+)